MRGKAAGCTGAQAKGVPGGKAHVSCVQGCGCSGRLAAGQQEMKKGVGHREVGRGGQVHRVGEAVALKEHKLT